MRPQSGRLLLRVLQRLLPSHGARRAGTPKTIGDRGRIETCAATVSAGVDIDRGDRFVEFISASPPPAVDKGIGGFSAALPLDSLGFRSPVLLTTTDGTGTKLLVAKKLGRYDTIGIDLVAMNVNDLLVCGAQPIVFLDYIACGKIDEERLHAVMRGIVRGCELAGVHASAAGRPRRCRTVRTR